MIDYIKLNDIYDYFISYNNLGKSFYDVINGIILDEVEIDNIHVENIRNEFILIPTIPVIAVFKMYIKYLSNKNISSKFRNLENCEYKKQFYLCLETNSLFEEYKDFEKKYAMEFGALWCETNNLIYTLKGCPKQFDEFYLNNPVIKLLD